MNKTIFFTAVFLISTSFSAFASNKEPELKFHPICKTISQLSGDIMADRQSGLTQEQAYNNIVKYEHEDYFEALTLISEAAYKKRIAPGTASKKDVITQFRVDVLFTCQRAAEDKMEGNSEFDRMMLRGALKTVFTQFAVLGI